MSKNVPIYEKYLNSVYLLLFIIKIIYILNLYIFKFTIKTTEKTGRAM